MQSSLSIESYQLYVVTTSWLMTIAEWYLLMAFKIDEYELDSSSFTEPSAQWIDYITH